MKKKDTAKLLELLKKSGSIDSYLKENKDFLIDCTLKEYLNLFLTEKNLTIAEASRASDISDRYCYQFLSMSNPRKPSRDILIQFCIGIQLNFDEIQTGLKIAEYAPLYPKDKRDSIIIFGIENSLTFMEINEELHNRGLKCLCKE